MKKYFIVYTALFLLIAVSLLSCNKSDADNTSPQNFTWSFNGNTYSTAMVKANTNGPGSGPRVIVAVIGTSYLSFERGVDFMLTSFDIGTYQFQSPGTNLIRYINEPNLPAGSVNTTINITSNSNNLLSGNFSGMMNDNSGSNKPISGTFTNVPVVQ